MSVRFRIECFVQAELLMEQAIEFDSNSIQENR